MSNGPEAGNIGPEAMNTGPEAMDGEPDVVSNGPKGGVTWTWARGCEYWPWGHCQMGQRQRNLDLKHLDSPGFNSLLYSNSISIPLGSGSIRFGSSIHSRTFSSSLSLSSGNFYTHLSAVVSVSVYIIVH